MIRIYWKIERTLLRVVCLTFLDSLDMDAGFLRFWFLKDLRIFRLKYFGNIISIINQASLQIFVFGGTVCEFIWHDSHFLHASWPIWKNCIVRATDQISTSNYIKSLYFKSYKQKCFQNWQKWGRSKDMQRQRYSVELQVCVFLSKYSLDLL